jgi:hypothetical protein
VSLDFHLSNYGDSYLDCLISELIMVTVTIIMRANRQAHRNSDAQRANKTISEAGIKVKVDLTALQTSSG